MISFIIWALVFTLVYAQSPLFTSNQNQYFLHGLSQAGFGNLNQDWLANTLDPTPIFSLLVEYTYRVFQSEIPFYFFYVLLMGIYLFSVFGIVDSIFELHKSKAKTLTFLSLFLVLHAAATRFLLSIVLHPDWAYLFEGGVANQRVLGTVLQPSTFGVFLVLSIYIFIRGHAYLAVLAAALAAIMHPTYLLNAGILTVAYMWITYQEEKQLANTLGIGALALALVLPILIYVYISFATTPSETLTKAREILVDFRIPHHALISDWWNWTVLLDIIFIVVALYLIRFTKLFSIMLIGTLTGIMLTLIQLITKNYALALIFPWRISVILVPLALSIITAHIVSTIFTMFGTRWTWFYKFTIVSSALVIILLFTTGTFRTLTEFSWKLSSHERKMMSFVYQYKSEDQNYLVPLKMQDFRLATGAPIYVDFKSIPYRDTDVLEWHRRQRLAGKFYRTYSCELLMQLASEDRVTHVILEFDTPGLSCPFLHEIYRNEGYGVYTISTP